MSCEKMGRESRIRAKEVRIHGMDISPPRLSLKPMDFRNAVQAMDLRHRQRGNDEFMQALSCKEYVRERLLQPADMLVHPRLEIRSTAVVERKERLVEENTVEPISTDQAPEDFFHQRSPLPGARIDIRKIRFEQPVPVQVEAPPLRPAERINHLVLLELRIETVVERHRNGVGMDHHAVAHAVRRVHQLLELLRAPEMRAGIIIRCM